ncbi:MAG: Hydroxyacylglutathione hydrolase [Myxococcales bacterium]|nr:Hydroxyacylglutathione hydrolase [Myxococcales bacterium]
MASQIDPALATPLPSAPEVVQLEVGLLQNFCEILFCPETREAAIVDPAWEVDRLLKEVAARQLKVTTVLVTHTHNDHIEGVAEVVAKTGAVVVVSPREAGAVRGDAQKLVDAVEPRDVAIGKCGVRVLDTPGHTVGGTCFLADGYIVTGDLLFIGGCGRTDFRGGDVAMMWRSLRRVAGLPEETRVYPGHDYGATPTSTIGQELRTNPYLLCKSFEEFRALRERKRA